MKNPLAPLFRSVLGYLRRTVRVSGEPTRQPTDRPLSREQFRELLLEALGDPATARAVARVLLLPALPIQGAACGTTADTIGSGDFGSQCNPADTGDYTFAGGGKVGVGTSSPGSLLQVGDGSASPELTIAGGNADYHNGAVVLDAWNGTNARALGIYMHDQGGDNEWFIGRPYAGSDAFVVNRKSSVASHDKSTADDSLYNFLTVTSGGNLAVKNSAVLGGIATKQSSDGPEKLSFQDSSAQKVCIANFKGSESNARFLLAVSGTMEWSHDGGDQTALLYIADTGRMNFGGDSGGWLGIVRRVSGALESQPRIILNNDGSGIEFTDGTNSADVSVSRPGANELYLQGSKVGINLSSPKFVLHTSGAALALGAPSSAPSDSDLNNSNISFWLDESNNKLKVRVKYSNGTLKTATIDLA